MMRGTRLEWRCSLVRKYRKTAIRSWRKVTAIKTGLRRSFRNRGAASKNWGWGYWGCCFYPRCCYCWTACREKSFLAWLESCHFSEGAGCSCWGRSRFGWWSEWLPVKAIDWCNRGYRAKNFVRTGRFAGTLVAKWGLRWTSSALQNP